MILHASLKPLFKFWCVFLKILRIYWHSSSLQIDFAFWLRWAKNKYLEDEKMLFFGLLPKANLQATSGTEVCDWESLFRHKSLNLFSTQQARCGLLKYSCSSVRRTFEIRANTRKIAAVKKLFSHFCFLLRPGSVLSGTASALLPFFGFSFLSSLGPFSWWKFCTA